MITAKLQGGLGNMLFQIAAIYSLAEDNKVSCGFNHQESINQGNSSKSYVKNIFKNVTFFEKNTNFSYIFNEDSFTHKPLPFLDNTIYNGYFQSELYFKHNKNKIFNLFELENVLIDNDIDKNKIAVHVRRGDYIKYSDTHTNLFETTSYYKKAFEYFGLNKDYIVFSDDIDWCKKNICLQNIEYSKEDSDVRDLASMAKYPNKIIANSSFSWWAAWLTNNKDTVIAPAHWFTGKNIKKWNTIYSEDWRVI